MEAAVVGAAVSATISVALKNLLSFLGKEIGRVQKFKKDLQKLEESVVMIQEFLEDSEKKQVTDKSVQRWLMKLEAAVYVLNNINDQLLRKKVQRGNKLKKKVRCFFPNPKSFAFHYKMARKIKNINKELKSINQEAMELGHQMRLACAPARGAGTHSPEYLETDSFYMDPVFVGRDDDVAEIVRMVTTAATQHLVSVVSIDGMGGLGKTTLTRKVFNDADIISHFGKRIWVHVSENFNSNIVLKSVVASSTGENVDGSREVMLQKLQQSVGDKKYLLVLDNVLNLHVDRWSHFFYSIKGISSVKGNVIIVTSRNLNVANIVQPLSTHALTLLSEQNCWLIIKAEAFNDEESISSEIETIGVKIAERCAGLPLAAQVVGSLLRGKSIEEWASIEEKWLSDFSGDINIISKILKLSFDNLPSPSLKKCFALCSIFPRGWLIEKDELAQLWMAEGILQNDQEKDMEIVGYEVVDVLVQNSLLQVSRTDDYGNVKHCVMHDLVYDLASSMLNSKFSDDEVRYISTPFTYNSSRIAIEHAKCLRAILVYDDMFFDDMKFSNFQCLHVLILNSEHIYELRNEIKNLIYLRYLDISHTNIECLPKSIGHLYHLQTLRATNKYGGGSLKKLPDTLKFLTSLRHLCIPNIKLPPKIGKLISLQTLAYFQVGDEKGRGIMELGSLKNLKGEIEIYNLEKVRHKEEATSANLFHKPDILKLKLVWNESKEYDQTNDTDVLEGLQPHWNLRSLKIKGFKGRSFPLWTSRMEVRKDVKDPGIRLDSLLEIELSDCKECEEIPMFGHLPRLKSLYLRHLSNVKSIGCSFYGTEENGVQKETIILFPVLQKLELNDMENLTTWEEVALPSSSGTQPRKVSVFGRLGYLKISNCPQLKKAPTHFPCLKEFRIHNMESGLPLASICGSKLTTLTKLNIREVDGLVCLPNGLFNNNPDLVELDISYCNNLLNLLSALGGGGASLRMLKIHYCSKFEKLGVDVHNLNALEELRIWSCPNLKSIAYPNGRQSSSQGLTSFRHLEFHDCTGLTNLPCEMLELCAQSLEWLVLNGLKSLTNLPQVISFLHNTPRLTTLEIKDVPKLTDVAAMKRGYLGSLENLYIGGSSDCQDYVSFVASLDRIFPALKSLHELRLYGMEEWDTLPDQIQHLTALRILYLHGFGIEELPEWIESLSLLKSLELLNCQKLRRLPSKNVMLNLLQLFIIDCPLLKQNIASDDSERSKVAHILYLNILSKCDI